MSLTAFLYGGLVDGVGQIITRYTTLGDKVGLKPYYLAYGPVVSLFICGALAAGLLMLYDALFGGGGERRATVLFILGAFTDMAFRYTRPLTPLNTYYDANEPWKTMVFAGVLASFMYWM